MEGKVSIDKTMVKKNLNKNFREKTKKEVSKTDENVKKTSKERKDAKVPTQHKSDGCYTYRPFEEFFKNKK
jgi:hypothetical protein